MLTAYTSRSSDDVIIIPKWKVPLLVVSNWVWNYLRRPFVKRWQAEVVAIASQVRSRLNRELLPFLYDNMRAGCYECSFMYSFLKGQPFTSEIEKALAHAACARHVFEYRAFHIAHEELFNRSHTLSDLICGFKSQRK